MTQVPHSTADRVVAYPQRPTLGGPLGHSPWESSFVASILDGYVRSAAWASCRHNDTTIHRARSPTYIHHPECVLHNQTSRMLGAPMHRVSAEEFLAQVLDAVPNVSSDLRERLLALARRAPSTRVPELVKTFEEQSRG